METLQLSFLLATSQAVTQKLACTQIPSSSSLSLSCRRANHSIASRCSSKNSIVISERLNNTATPWLMLPSVSDETTGDKLDCFYSLADGQTVRLNRKKSLQVPDTATCIASTMGWLGYVDAKDGRVYLSNPFLKDVVELPSLETLPLVLGVRRDPITNDILHFKVRISDYATHWDRSELDPYELVKPEHMIYHLSNLSLSSADPRGCDCVVMALQGDGYRRLAYCPISRQFTQDTDFDGLAHQFDPNSWTGLQEDYVHFPGLAYNQVVYDTRRSLFYAMFDDSGILAFDVLSDRGRRSKMVFNIRKETLVYQLKRAFEEQGSEALKDLRNKCKTRYYLVSLENGDLLLVVRHYEIPEGSILCSVPHKTLHFDVFRVVYSGNLEPVTCLNNDRAIFIGFNQSFCLRASSSPGIRPNCIYFTDDVSSGNYNVHSRNQWGHDMGIFDMEDGIITPFYPYQDEQEEKKVPLSTPLFWVAPLLSDIWYLAREQDLDEDKLAELG
ncbi:uncharacterized protein LOC141614088 [Silene latifolia]|uniref:uncharacterized protein LOC141614088 n=1 Tax=Silene latifolia TaxID=37657 RepID=UPI003D77AD99